MMAASVEKKLGAVLAEKTWVAFDLDDTLHEFRRASSAAAGEVLGAMHKRYGVPLTSLQAQYGETLRDKTAHAFADGRSSSEYRRERFLAVAQHFGAPLEAEPALLDALLRLYETTLAARLELHDGAGSLLLALRARGKKIAVVTEGPQDAQEWTVAKLGIDAARMAYVGDSEDRDMRPARRENILAFHYVPQEECDLEAPQPRINSLRKLESILTSHYSRSE